MRTKYTIYTKNIYHICINHPKQQIYSICTRHKYALNRPHYTKTTILFRSSAHSLSNFQSNSLTEIEFHIERKSTLLSNNHNYKFTIIQVNQATKQIKFHITIQNPFTKPYLPRRNRRRNHHFRFPQIGSKLQKS